MPSTCRCTSLKHANDPDRVCVNLATEHSRTVLQGVNASSDITQVMNAADLRASLMNSLSIVRANDPAAP